jgi:glycosyltransferase involved in cell wall biosynthesis
VNIVISNASPKWGGLHEVTEMLARGLKARGHEITVFAHSAGILEERMAPVAHVETVLSGMDLSPLTIVRAARSLKRWKADVALLMSKKDVRLTGPAAWMQGIPYVIRYANDRPLRSAYDWLLFGRLPSGQIANSMATRTTLLRSAPWLKEELVTVIHNGIDPARFDGAGPAPLGLPADALTFGFIGRLERRKGLLDLAYAWPRVARAVSNAHLVIVGKGPNEHDVRGILSDAPRVHWLGFRKDVPEILHATDIAVVPSHWEGFGLVALEALTAGKPVIATRASSLPEIVDDGVQGRLVPPQNPDALAKAMIDLARDPEARKQMGAAGYSRARREFSLEKMLDGYEEVLTRAVANSETGRGASRQ